MRVLVQFRSSPAVHAATLRGEALPEFAAATAAPIPGLIIDPAYLPVQVPTPLAAEPGASPYRYSPAVSFSMAPEQATYLVRGTVPDDPDSQRVAVAEATARPEVVGVFSDPVIETCLVCPGDPAVGSDQDVAGLLGVKALADAGMDGYRVSVAIVDTGINLAHLESKGRDPKFSSRRSWTPAGVATKPGKHPVGHGTMCAYDVGIAAPKATLIDHALLLSQTPGETAMSGLLSDAVLAYAKLLGSIQAMTAGRRALVVNNSWGMFSPAWDFPVGHPGNYSDNPAHPFNVIVASLEAAGADILFAAATAPTAAAGSGRPGRSAGPTPTRASCRSPGSTPASAASATPRRDRAGSTPTSRTCRPTPTSWARACTRPTAAPRPPARSRPGWWRRCASSTPPRCCPRPSCGPCCSRLPRTWAGPASITTSAGA
jgi:Subtilase family